jgi:hypothetical protein
MVLTYEIPASCQYHLNRSSRLKIAVTVGANLRWEKKKWLPYLADCSSALDIAVQVYPPLHCAS